MNRYYSIYLEAISFSISQDQVNQSPVQVRAREEQMVGITFVVVGVVILLFYPSSWDRCDPHAPQENPHQYFT